MRRLKTSFWPCKKKTLSRWLSMFRVRSSRSQVCWDNISVRSQGSAGWNTVFGMNPSFPIPNWKFKKNQKIAAYMDKCSLSQIKTVQFEISYSSSLQKNYKRMDVLNDLYFYVTMVLPTLPQIPVKLFWGVIKRLVRFYFQI